MLVRPLRRSAAFLAFALALYANGHVAPTPVEAAPAPKKAAADPTFGQKIQPFLRTYCTDCHNGTKQAGGLALDVYRNEAHARKDRLTWEEVRKRIAAGDMPPKKHKAQPSKGEKELVLNWVETTLTKVDCTGPRDPGRVTLRRLNRVEYNNTVRDLLGVSLTPADDFPADDIGYGFDNIGDVLSLQPILLEKYLAAAERVLNAAIPALDRIPSSVQTYRPQNIQVLPRSARSEDRRRVEFTTSGEVAIEKFNFPAAGEYSIRVRAWGHADAGTAPNMTYRIDGRDAKTFVVTAHRDQPTLHEFKLPVKAGERRVSVAFTNPSKERTAAPRSLGILSVEVEGPLGGAARSLPDSTKLVLIATPATPRDAPAAARQVLANFTRRAYRRPSTPAEVDRLMKLFDTATANGERFEQAIKLPMKAVLVSPHFLFRVEADPADPEAVRPLNDFELATRLSYFLWSSMPDEELFAAASRGDLTRPGGVATQIARMTRDPKSVALTENFAGQWLQLRGLDAFVPDASRFPAWDESLRQALPQESEAFFDHVMRTDRSVLDFLDADYTFVNSRLAKHYGIPDVYGPHFRQVKSPDGRRGGVVTQAAVLAVTSNPTRTSPVKRGKWVYENVLGLTAPPPAPDVPELPPVGKLKGTLRQQMEQHRADPNCATCHAKLDPLGFGLENFDAIGAWREQDNAKPIDSSGILPDGAKFRGPIELRKVLLGKADLFRRCLAEKMLTYALGRGLEYYDKCTVDEIVTKLKAGNDRFSVLLIAVTASDAFRMRKGKRSE